MPYDAIVLAGGRARRLGGIDKPSQRIGVNTLLERVVAAVADAEQVVVVGPHRTLAPGIREVTWCRENPAGGGPVAAVAAGLPATTADIVVVLGADLPWVAPGVPHLVSAVPGAGVAALADATGRVNHLAAAWRRTTLAAALAALPVVTGAAMRSLIGGIAVVRVGDDGGWGADCDTWDDVAAARARQH
ncbi:MAG: molybdenum cofactor guanylyltransferase [Jatrophihabitans sp.]